MNKKQKIKEMAKDLQAAEEKAGKVILKETRKFLEENARYNSKTDYIKAHVKSCFELAAEALYNAGYRNISNGAVVLTAEENSDYILLKQNYEHAQNVIKDLQAETRRAVCKAMDFMSRLLQARKETAKEILSKSIEKYDKLHKKLADKEISVWDFACMVRAIFFDVAEEYGVEIEIADR